MKLLRRKSSTRKTTDRAKTRLQSLDGLKHRLFKDHPVISTMEYAFGFIDDYGVVNDSERTYCQEVLRQLYRQAYDRYAK